MSVTVDEARELVKLATKVLSEAQVVAEFGPDPQSLTVKTPVGDKTISLSQGEKEAIAAKTSDALTALEDYIASLK